MQFNGMWNYILNLKPLFLSSALIKIVHKLLIEPLLSMQQIKQIFCNEINYQNTLPSNQSYNFPSFHKKSNNELFNNYLCNINCFRFGIPEHNQLLQHDSWKSFLSLGTFPTSHQSNFLGIIQYLITYISQNSIKRSQNLNNFCNETKNQLTYANKLNSDLSNFNIKSIIHNSGSSNFAKKKLNIRRKINPVKITKHKNILNEYNTLKSNENYISCFNKTKQQIHRFQNKVNNTNIHLLKAKQRGSIEKQTLLTIELNALEDSLNRLQNEYSLFVVSNKYQYFIYKKTKDLLIRANKTNSGGNGKELIGTKDSQLFVYQLFKSQIEYIPLAHPRRSDAKLRIIKSKLLLDNLFLFHCFFMSISLFLKIPYHSLKCDTALSVIQDSTSKWRFNPEHVRKDMWKSPQILKQYIVNNPKTIQGQKIINGPSLQLFKSQNKRKIINTSNHLNKSYCRQLQISSQQTRIIQNNDKEILIGAQDAATMIKHLTHEGIFIFFINLY